ncbi:MAG TPA: beta-propeller domain-containing protein [Haliangiales bacterium]|nr:beta-propeller domain-containing protein [Haliangiales bacterium]
MTTRTRLAWFLFLAAACGNGGPTPIEVSLASYDTCAALEADLKAMLMQEVEATFDQMRKGWWAFPVEDGTPTPATNMPRQEGVDYSGTNNQEAGVDEADFVKTDGYYIYNLNGNRLHIFGVPQFGDLDPLSVTTVEGWPREMLVAGDRVAVFSTVPVNNLPDDHPLKTRLGHRDPNGVWFFRTWDVTKITVLDVTDRAHPALVRELFLEGWYQAARKVDTSVRAGTYTWMNIPGLYYWGWYNGQNQTIDQREAAAKAAVAALALTDIVPVIYERLPDRTFHVWSLTQNGCRSFYRPTSSQGRGISTLLTFDLAASEFKFDTDQILTNYATFYASQDYLYLAEAAHDWWWFWWNDRDEDETNIHMFDIRNPQKTFYVASGRVPGRVFDSFSLGEKDGFLRAATTTNWENRWWLPADQRPRLGNNIYVLEPHGGRLKVVGKLEGLAEGERIFGARFLGDEGFLVTFRQVDPLHTLDLSDPYHPVAVGELVTPGVATYLHPIAGGRLLTIGWGGDTTGLNWRTQIGLFDVSNFAAPRLQDTLDLAVNGWAYSEAQWEHKAFQYWPPRKLLAIPLASYRTVAGYPYPTYLYLSSLALISVDLQTGLRRVGDIDHSGFYNSATDKYWAYVDIRRSIFMGDFIYAISDRGITVNRLADLAPVTSAPLPGWQPNDLWWWW